MKRSLAGRVTLVGGGLKSVGADLVRRLLLENAFVIVPTRNGWEFDTIKASVADVKKGKLIPFITDMADFDKALEMFEGIVRQLGKIELGIVMIETPPPSPCLTELDILDWHRMLEGCITSFFTYGRIILGMMKENRQGVYITVADTDSLVAGRYSALTNLAARQSLEISSVFAEEVKDCGVGYHHFLVGSTSCCESVTIPAQHFEFIGKHELCGRVLQKYQTALVPQINT